MERWLPWTEMRHTNKTEISLAAMALVVTGNVSVHNHRRVYMFCRVSLAELRLDRVMVVGRVHCSVPGGEVLHILLLLLLLCPSVAMYTVHGTVQCTVQCTVHTDRRIGAQL